MANVHGPPGLQAREAALGTGAFHASSGPEAESGSAVRATRTTLAAGLGPYRLCDASGRDSLGFALANAGYGVVRRFAG